MVTASFSVRAIALEQTERTRQSSKADIERFIEESELKIASLESQITALVELRDRERATVSTLRYLIAPIHTLPVELLAEIFQLTIDDNTHIKDAFRISQVCSDWRQVAHSTPRLWAGPLRVPLEARESEQVYADELKSWLARSASLHIPVILEFKRRETVPLSPRISEEIFRIAPRWRSLRVETPTYPQASLVRRVAECSLDSLEELNLGFIEQDAVDADTIPSFMTASRLQKLSISLDEDSHRILVPWVQSAQLIKSCEQRLLVRAPVEYEFRRGYSEASMRLRLSPRAWSRLWTLAKV